MKAFFPDPPGTHWLHLFISGATALPRTETGQRGRQPSLFPLEATLQGRSRPGGRAQTHLGAGFCSPAAAGRSRTGGLTCQGRDPCSHLVAFEEAKELGIGPTSPRRPWTPQTPSCTRAGAGVREGYVRVEARSFHTLQPEVPGWWRGVPWADLARLLALLCTEEEGTLPSPSLVILGVGLYGGWRLLPGIQRAPLCQRVGSESPFAPAHVS